MKNNPGPWTLGVSRLVKLRGGVVIRTHHVDKGVVIRTHHVDKNLYITVFLLGIFGPDYYCTFPRPTVAPQDTSQLRSYTRTLGT